LPSPAHPEDSGTFTRPIYPYPLYAKYAGGDPNKAESFSLGAPLALKALVGG
jgi:hypothetical protein